MDMPTPTDPPAHEAADPADPLKALQWEKRIVLVFAQNADDLALQNAAFGQAREGLAERDLELIVITPDEAVYGVADRNHAVILQRFKTPTSDFEVVLIGLDGGVKQRWTEPVTAQTLFAVIDAMPMRRQELREQTGG